MTFPSLPLAPVSHVVSEKGAWAKRGWTHFAVCPRFQSPAPPVSLGPASPFQHLFDAFSASFGTWMPLRVATGKRFGHLDAVSALPRRSRGHRVALLVIPVFIRSTRLRRPSDHLDYRILGHHFPPVTLLHETQRTPPGSQMKSQTRSLLKNATGPCEFN